MSSLGQSTVAKPLAEYLRTVKAPKYEAAVPIINRWMVRRRLSAQSLADGVGLGRSTLNHWLQGRWPDWHPDTDPWSITARLWDYMERNPVPDYEKPSARVLETRNFAELRRLFHIGLRQRAMIICYGAPSAEKTFGLKQLCAEHRYGSEGKGPRDDVVYIECIPRMSPLNVCREICAQLGTAVRSNFTKDLFHSIVAEVEARPRRPLVILDEAQHLPYESFEIVRRLRDLAGRDLADDPIARRGFGVLFAGSHDMLQRFISPRNKPRMTQFNQRVTHTAQLTGMDENEVLALAAKELGNGKPARLNDELRARILKACREIDAYAVDESGTPTPREYFSPRRLARWIESAREKLASRRSA